MVCHRKSRPLFSSPTHLVPRQTRILISRSLARADAKWLAPAMTCVWPALLALVVVAAAAATASAAVDQPDGLLTDLRDSPALGVSATPTFTWIVPHVSSGCATAGSGGQVQAAYQVQAFSATGAVVVDSGQLQGNTSVDVAIATLGNPRQQLQSGGLFSWRVKVWTAPLTSTTAVMAPSAPVAGVAASSSSSTSSPHTSSTALCESMWSDNATFVVGLGTTGFSSVSQAIWVPTADNYAYFHRVYSAAAGKSLARAIAFVTAVGDDRLLGAYRLYAGGATASIGPGRGDASLAHDGNLVYDTVDVTPNTSFAAAAAAASSVVLGLQCYHSDHTQAGVLLELHLHYTDGSSEVAGGTDASWMALGANHIYNPTGTEGGAYNVPQEDIDAAAYPVGWAAQSAVDPSLGWANASLATGSPLHGLGGQVPRKPTAHLEVTEYVDPVRTVQVAPGHWFFDFGTGFMGGMRVELPAGQAFAGKSLVLTLSEELAAGSNTSVLYPMRTGNKYMSVLKARASPSAITAPSVFEHHEYMLFRCAFKAHFGLEAQCLAHLLPDVPAVRAVRVGLPACMCSSLTWWRCSCSLTH
jgi:hypothetical protein